METHLIKHALRVSAGGNDGYHPEGWNPKLRVTLMGPTPSDTELVWTQYLTDGTVWFEHNVSLPQLEDEQMHDASLQRWESGTDIGAEGSFRFTLRMVNELDGIDELLHSGVIQVARRAEGENVFGVDHSSLLTTGLVALDVHDQNDAPKLRTTVFLGGSVDTYEVEAHLFHEGKRISKASYVDSGYDFTSNDGQSLAREFIAEFDGVRGWNNLTDQGWGDDDWHLLDTADGSYEIKVTRGGKVNRTMKFEVADGRIVKDDLIEPDTYGRPCLWRAAEIVGTFDGDTVTDPSAPRAYGDIDTSTFDYSSDGMYWFRKDASGSDEEESPYDEETAERVQGVVDTAVRLIETWEEHLTAIMDDEDARSFQFLLQCEQVVRDVDDFEPRFDALGGVADNHELSVRGDTAYLGDAARRVRYLREVADGYINGANDSAESVLAPYRAILRNDKLAIFEDHPAPDFRYYTTNKHVIESAEELAEATEWFFEGSNDIEAKATVDGKSITGSVTGWRVLGYRFDDDHALVEESEVQGSGSSAPKSAFVVG